MSELSRQIIAILAFIFLGPTLMITSLKYADVVKYEMKEAKEKEEED